MTGVLMTADAFGGVWTYALELTEALGAEDHRVHLATLGRPLTDEQRAAAASSGVASLHESAFALEWMPDPWADVERSGDWLRWLSGELGVDVVHLNGYAHGALDWSVPTVVVAHSCVLSWWWSVHREPAPPSFDRYRDAVARGLEGAGAVVAPTHWMLGQLRRWYGFTGGTVIPNCRRRSGTSAPKESFVFAAGRRWDEAKNLDLLERVASEVRCPIVVAGDPDGPEPGVRPETPAVRLRTVGLLDADGVADWLARARVFAAPARYEPFGLAALEAALARCSLVLGDIPSLREVWGGAALFVDPDDDDGWAAALEGLCADPLEAERRGRLAAGRAELYRPELCGAAYGRLYETVLSAQGAAR